METTVNCTTDGLNSIDLKAIPDGSFRISPLTRKSKTIDLFDDLYTYPPKFRVKWDMIDELHEDLFMSYNYRVYNQKISFPETMNHSFNNEEDGTIKTTQYSSRSYFDGYLNKVTSTKLYGKQAKKFQDSLQKIPAYIILNGQGQIVLATSTEYVNSKTLSKEAYEFCGSFDPLVETTNQLGLFFMSKKDAEVYLNEVVKADTQGTKMLGLSIHCVGLDFAYRVMREYHPNVDFRFVPDLTEVQSLLTPKNIESSNLVFENDQQQLRLRKRPAFLFPGLATLTKRFSPFKSFLEHVEYFKGVPIYIVNVNKLPAGFFTQQCINTVNLIDNVYGRLIKFVGTGFGFGNNLILEGSIKNQKIPSSTQTYIFFEQTAAAQFCQSYKRQIGRYHGSHLKLLEPVLKQPKILVYNLEDLLEMLEEQVTLTNGTIKSSEEGSEFKFNSFVMVPTKQALLDVDNFLSENKKSPLRKVIQFCDFKYRSLTGFFEILLNTN